MRSRALMTAGLVLLAVLHESVTGQLFAPVLAVAVAAAAALLGPRVTLHQASQALVLVATIAVTFALALVDTPLSPKLGGPKLQYVIASGAALLTVGARLWMHNPERGHGATQVIGLLVFYACGRVTSPLYLPLVVGWLGLAWLHAASLREGPSGLTLRHFAAGAGLLAVTAGLGGASTLSLRGLYGIVDARFMAWSGGDAETGFGAGAFRLGSMDGMLQSDEVILRVHGPVEEHLRGQAYSEYIGGVWLPPGDEPAAALRGDAPSGDVTTLEFVSEAQKRLFLPANAASVAADPASLMVDALGIPQPGNDLTLTEVSFDTTGAPVFPPPAPTDADLQVPVLVLDAIGPMVRAWTEGADTPAQALRQIEQHLEADYTYSLHYERGAGDPVVEFMRDSKLGHCEYFASAMALSARISGIPARVITGFRASETSPFGGHGIVRGRDAHAWVEAYMDGAWVMVDPSPQNSMEAATVSGFLAGARDDLRLLWKQYGLQGLVATLVVVFVGLQIRTLLRGRQPPPASIEEAWIEGPPAYMLALLRALAEQELERAPAEAVEAFADRAAAAGQEEAGVLLRRYAAIRYGALGAPEGLEGDVEGWLAGHQPPG